MPALYLHKVIHPQAHDNCRVILKYEVGAVEIGSIGIQHGSGATAKQPVWQTNNEQRPPQCSATSLSGFYSLSA
jgi:hypothetical protein